MKLSKIVWHLLWINIFCAQYTKPWDNYNANYECRSPSVVLSCAPSNTFESVQSTHDSAPTVVWQLTPNSYCAVTMAQSQPKYEINHHRTTTISDFQQNEQIKRVPLQQAREDFFIRLHKQEQLNIATDQKRVQQRSCALSEAQESATWIRSFILDAATQNILAQCSIEKERFQTMEGNSAQIQLHQELIEIAQQSGTLYRTAAIKSILALQPSCEFVVKFADIAIDANRQGDLITGYSIADWCWQGLECLRAIAEGVKDGLCTVAKETYHHPIQAAGMIIAPELVLAYHLIPMSWELIKGCTKATALGIEYLHDPKNAREEFQEFIAPLQAIKSAAYDYYHDNGLKKFLRDGICVATQLTVQQKLCTKLGSLYEKAEDNLKRPTTRMGTYDANLNKIGD